MKIAIIGTGGVGGYFGAKLAKAGYHVTFLARGKHLDTMKKNGLTIKSISGNFKVDSVLATDRIKDIGESDLILLAVKAWQVKELAAEIKTIVHKDSVVLPLQNGVLASEELMEHIDAKNVISGLCKILSKIEAPGVIDHFGITPTIVFGELSKGLSPRTKEIKAIFDKSGIESVLAEDIYVEMWKKFIAICVSGLLTVTKTTYGELRELKETRQMMIDLYKEIYNLAKKIGINIEANYVDKLVAFVDTFPYESTTSLTRDVWDGKPSEIEYQHGTVVRLAERYGVDVPINKFIYHCILPMEMKARKLN